MRRESYAKLFTALDNSIHSTFEILNNVDLLSYMKTINISKYFSEKNMNLKKLVSFSMLLVLLAFVGMTNAATYYVNNQSGNDGWPGTQAQPKKTVASALIAAPSGSTISVAYTGVDYTETNITINGDYTFVSTGGNTPRFLNARLIIGTLGAPNVNGTLTLTGPFRFDGGLDLLAGTVNNGNQLTIGTNGAPDVYRTEYCTIANGQLQYAAASGYDFVYENVATAAGFTLYPGLEFPVATGIARDLTTTSTGGALNLALDQDRTINGLLSLDEGADLNGHTFTIVGASLLHNIDESIVDGTLAFTLTGATTIDGDGGEDLPNVSASAAAANTLTLGAALNEIGSLTANTAASITATNAGDIGNVTLNGSGTILTQNVTGVVGAVLGATGSTGIITLGGNVTQQSTSITQSGLGLINYDVAVVGDAVVTGNVLMNGAVAFSNSGAVAGDKVIDFNVGPGLGTTSVTIGGSVTNNASFSGSSNDPGNDDNALINFSEPTAVIQTGAVVNSVSGTVAVNNTTTNGTADSNGEILFAQNNGSILTLAITNSSSVVRSIYTGATNTNIGNIRSTSLITGGLTTGALLNSSTANGLDGHNEINFASVTGVHTFNGSVTSQGGVGGDIRLGDGNIAMGATYDIINNRTDGSADIFVGTVGTAGVQVTVRNVTVDQAGSVIFNSVLDGDAVLGTSDVTVSGTLTVSGTGTVEFPDATVAEFGIRSLVVSNGTLDLGDEVALATGAINVTGQATLTNGTIDLGGGVRTLDFSGAQIQIGGNTTSPTWTNGATCTMQFDQPIPNVNQIVTIGLADPQYPGPVVVANQAVLPAPYVYFQSLGGTTTAANLYILNNLTFNTVNPAVPNTVHINNVRVNVGKNGVGGGTGNFDNITGYTTENDGMVMMSGNAGLQTVNAGGPTILNAVFGGFGVDNDSDPLPLDGAAEVTFTNPCVFTQEFYLAEGDVDNVNVSFNVSPLPALAGEYPTIYRTEGAFIGYPTWTSMVNVVYYGTDKATSFEIPNALDKLNDLEVATTNGAAAGKGVITLGIATQVNGTLTINADQTLYINNFGFALAGQTANINGHLINTANNPVVLNTADGVDIIGGTGATMCDILVANGSLGNTLTGFAKLVNDAFGGDGVWGTNPNADDFATADASITYQDGADTGSSLAVTFTGAGPHFTNIDMTSPGLVYDNDQTFTINSNVRISGNLLLEQGLVSLGTWTLQHDGVAPALRGGARIIGADILFPDLDQDYTLTITNSPALIEATVNFTMGTVPGPANNYFDFTAGATLELRGPVNLNSGEVQIPSTSTLLLSGPTVNVAAGTGGFNCLAADAWVISNVYEPDATQTLTTPSTTIDNFQVADNLTLQGGVVSGTLTTDQLVHSAGLLTFGTCNIFVNQSFARTGNTTYDGDGWLIYNGLGNGFQQGATPGVTTPMVINNLQVNSGFKFQANNTNNLVVVDELWLNNAAIDNAIPAVAPFAPGYLHVGDATTLPVVHATGGAADILNNAIVTDNGQIDYLFDGAAFVATNLLWPQSVANDVELDMNTAGTPLTVNSNRTIAGDLDLTTGILNVLNGVTVDMPTPGSDIFRTANASIALAGAPNPGNFTAADIDLFYSGTLTGGVEYSNPTIVRDVTLAAGAVVTIQNGRTIDGNLALNGAQLNLFANTTFALPQNIGNGTIDVGAVATPADLYFNQGATIGGTLNVNGASHTAHYGQVFVPAGGLVINGSLFNDGFVDVTEGLTINGVYDGTNGWDDVLVDHATVNGTVLLGYGSTVPVPNTVGSIWTVWGTSSLVVNTGGTFNSVGVTPIPATATPNELYLDGNLTVNGTGQFIGNMLNLFSQGADDVVYTMPAAGVTLNDFNVVSANADPNNVAIINVNNGNINVAGNLNLRQGIVNVQTPFILSLTPTTAFMFDHYVMTDLGYTRIPVADIDPVTVGNQEAKTHVVGNLGIFVRENVEGRIEYPLGALNGDLRTMAITFTTSNRTITPTTIVASHFDTDALGVVNFPINGGTKFLAPTKTNWISSRAPYYWRVYATTALGASQLFNVELLGTEVHRPFETVNDLRIIRRFDGNVEANGWYLQGDPGNYSNIMQLDVPAPGDTNITVRNINSQGGIVTQAALFTIGIPSQAPRFTNVLADQAIDEGTTLTFDYDAVDDDLMGDPPVYSLVINPTTAHASINPSTGVFTFSPDFTEAGVYTVTVQAAKGGEPTVFSQTTATVTVNNVNRAPVIATELASQTIDDSQVINFTYTATDEDSDPLTWGNLVVTPVAPAVAFAGTASITAGGVFVFDPAFADAGKQFTVQVQVTDGALVDVSTLATITVEYSRLKGDVDNNDLVQAFDASLVLQEVVGMIPTPAAGSEDFWATDADANLAIGAYDAYYILYYVTNAIYPDLSMPKAIASGNVDFGSLTRVDEEVVSIPVKISNTSNVLSAQISLNVDASVASVDQIVSNLPKGWIMAHNFADGKLNIAMTGMNPIEDGNIVAVNLRLKNKEAKFDVDGSVTLNDNSEIALAKASVRQIPSQYELSQNYPNPFNPSTTIKYALATDSRVSIHIYNMLGEKVRTLVNNQQEAGYYSVQWDGSNDYNQKVSSGIYIYRLEAGSFVQTKKMNLIK